MLYVVGTDEAGYGPNLGPLVVSGTVWQVPDATADEALYELLSGCVTASPSTRRTDDGRVVLADSKVLYKSTTGIAALERGALAAVGAIAPAAPGQKHIACPRDWQGLWDRLAPDSILDRQASPWYAQYQCDLPLEVAADELACSTRTLSDGLASAGVRLMTIRSRAVFPAQFNDLIETPGSKGTALSRITLSLAAELLAELPPGPVLLICDKHGGRNRYGQLLQTQFPDFLVESHGEGRLQSVYRLGPSDRRVEVHFRCRAEASLPVALASMISKYLRELAMRAFNQYWCGRVPRLRPTAGYPGDALRFKRKIARTQAELGFDDRLLWRTR